MDASPHGRHAKPSRFGRVPVVIVDLAVFAGIVLFRWLGVVAPIHRGGLQLKTAAGEYDVRSRSISDAAPSH